MHMFLPLSVYEYRSFSLSWVSVCVASGVVDSLRGIVDEVFGKVFASTR